MLILDVYTPYGFCNNQIHSFIQQMSIEHLSYATHYVYTGYNDKQKNSIHNEVVQWEVQQ